MDVTRPVRRRDRLLPAGLGDPAADLGHPRPGRADRRTGPDAPDRPAAEPAPATQRPPAPPDGRPVQHRQRHRRAGCGCCAGSAASRSSTTATAASRRPPAAPASRSPGCSRCSTRSRSSCPASSWCSWSGSARGTPSPGRSRAGELVAFYGYSAFLMIPLRTATEYANKLIRARVAAAADLPGAGARPRPHRPRDTWRRRRPWAPTCTTSAPACTCAPGLLTAVVADQPDESAALADRLGLCAAVVDDDVRLGGVPLTGPARAAEVRQRIVVSDTGATFFSGRLGDRLDVRGRGGLDQALDTASARRHPRRARRRPRHHRRRARPHASPAASGSGWSWPAR